MAWGWLRLVIFGLLLVTVIDQARSSAIKWSNPQSIRWLDGDSGEYYTGDWKDYQEGMDTSTIHTYSVNTKLACTKLEESTGPKTVKSEVDSCKTKCEQNKDCTAINYYHQYWDGYMISRKTWTSPCKKDPVECNLYFQVDQVCELLSCPAEIPKPTVEEYWQSFVIEKVSETSCTPNPCKNGGICDDKEAYINCGCTAEWEGAYCQKDSGYRDAGFGRFYKKIINPKYWHNHNYYTGFSLINSQYEDGVLCGPNIMAIVPDQKAKEKFNEILGPHDTRMDVDPKTGKWSDGTQLNVDFEGMSVECLRAYGTKYYQVEKKNIWEGSESTVSNLNRKHNQGVPCDVKAIMCEALTLDGGWAEWGAWTCSDGSTSNRKRTCTNPARRGAAGKDCVGKDSEDGKCDDGKWAATVWESCSTSLGTRNGKRSCTNPNPTGGKDCVGDVSVVEKCDVDGGIRQWENWGACGATKKSTRVRTCSFPTPKNNGKKCVENLSEEADCVNGEWTTWAAWGQCTNLGLRVRLRTCDNPAAKNGGADCPGSKIEREACANGNWATWEQWSLCTGGERSRKRTCTDPSPLNGGTDCDAAGIVNERQNCTNGEWSTWSTWSDCNGVKITRVRTCTNPSPSIGGKQCAEAANEEQNCAHGGWDQWTQWSCGLPYYSRTRKCNQPAPLNGGLQCITTGNSGKIQQKVCGASVGGLVGALTVLLAIIYVWFCFYKKLCCFKREDPYEKEEIELQKKK